MRIGVFAKTFPGNVPGPVLQAVAAAGFDCAQFNWACAGLPSMPETVPRDAIDAALGAVRSSGVELVALSGTCNMIHPDPGVRAAGLDSLDVVLASAARLGVPLVTLCTGSRDPHDQWRAHPDNGTDAAWSDLLTSMERAVRGAERHDVMLGVEPELANTVDSARKAQRLLETCGPRVRIVFDPANLFEFADEDEQRRIVADALERLGPSIALAHAKDRLADGRFAVAGQGVIDWGHYVGGLKAAGFDGALVAHGLPPEAAESVCGFLRRAIG